MTKSIDDVTPEEWSASARRLGESTLSPRMAEGYEKAERGRRQKEPIKVWVDESEAIAKSEPVAWQLEWYYDGECKDSRLYDDERHCLLDAQTEGGICRPLYAAPQESLNLQDKAVQKRLAAQWGYSTAAMSGCKKCGGEMSPGQAIEQTYTGTPDFPGDAYPVTMSPGGPGKLIECSKCKACGWSVK